MHEVFVWLQLSHKPTHNSRPTSWKKSWNKFRSFGFCSAWGIQLAKRKWISMPAMGLGVPLWRRSAAAGGKAGARCRSGLMIVHVCYQL